MKTLNRYSPLHSQNHLFRNRVIIPPMASGTASREGYVTQKTLDHYANLGTARVGLLIAEYTYVHASGRSEENQLGISTPAHLPGLKALAKTIQQSGALAGIQLTHGGGKSDRELTGGHLMGPSSIAVPVKGETLETPRSMNEQDLEIWLAAFAAATDRAVAAGFDLVEFHSAHGYGLNQWLSPITNQRTDAYGGNLSSRFRLLLQVVSRARTDHPSLLISVRIPGQDFLEGGLKLHDMQMVGRALEKAGVNILHVSSGIGGWRRPADRRGEGYLVDEAAQIQAAVNIPVIGVGGIESGSYIDESLREGRFQLAAVGRAILKDPKAWGEKNLSVQPDHHAPVACEHFVGA